MKALSSAAMRPIEFNAISFNFNLFHCKAITTDEKKLTLS